MVPLAVLFALLAAGRLPPHRHCRVTIHPRSARATSRLRTIRTKRAYSRRSASRRRPTARSTRSTSTSGRASRRPRRRGHLRQRRAEPPRRAPGHQSQNRSRSARRTGTRSRSRRSSSRRARPTGWPSWPTTAITIKTNFGRNGPSASVTSRPGGKVLPANFRTDNVYPKDGPASIYAVERYNVLVFTKNATGGAAEGVAGLRALANANEVTFDVTDDASKFTESNLAKYRVVVFLNNAGELLDGDQQSAFEDYFRGGGGFLGIHSAIEAEPGWQFMSDLLGTRATGRTDPLSATTKVADRVHYRQQGPAGVLDADRPLVQLHEQRPRLLARPRDGRREHLQPGRGVRLRPSDRLVQGVPGRPLVLHRLRRNGRRVRGRQRPPSARRRPRLGGGQGRQELQRLRRHRAGELPADEDLGSAEHQRADRHRPAAGRPHPADGA